MTTISKQQSSIQKSEWVVQATMLDGTGPHPPSPTAFRTLSSTICRYFLCPLPAGFKDGLTLGTGSM